MKNIRKYTLSGISVFLLLCFSVTFLPTDAFHKHAGSKNTGTICKDIQGKSCQHKTHLSIRSSFCWACAVHFDKSFTKDPYFTDVTHPIDVKSIAESTQRFYQASIVQRTLRGPPAV